MKKFLLAVLLIVSLIVIMTACDMQTMESLNRTNNAYYNLHKDLYDTWAPRE